MKAKMISFEIYDPLYVANVVCVFNCNQDEFAEFLRLQYKCIINYGENDIAIARQDSVVLNTTKGKTTMFYVWIEKYGDDSTLVHECAHLTFSIFDDRGVEISRANDEAFCYYLDYIVARIKCGAKEIEMKGKKK